MSLARPSARSFLSLGFALAGVFAVGFYATAAHQGGSHYIPYQGRLELNGSLVDATLPMSFAFQNQAGSELDRVTLPTVTVQGGAFSTLLGPLSDSVVLTDPLYLQIEVDGVVLGDRQLLGAVPRASVSQLASGLKVTQDLDVGGNISAAGHAYVDGSVDAAGQGLFGGSVIAGGSVAAGGSVTAGGNSNPLLLGSNWTGSTDPGPNRAEIANDTGTYKSLMVVGNRSAGDARKVGVWDDLSVARDLNVGRDVNIAGRILLDSRNSYNLDVAGGRGWGSWQAWSDCAVGYYVCGLQQRVESDQGGGDDTAVNDIAIRCCTLGW